MPGLTELEAVNDMLSLIGEAPIATLDGDLIVEAALARNLLGSVSKALQEIGFHFNTDYDFALSPDVSGFIYVPGDAIRVDSDYTDVAVRGDKLYNRETNSYTFTGTLRCEVVRYFEFEDLPPAVRRYVTAMATTMFVIRTLGSSEVVSQARSEEIKAKALFLTQELETGDYTMLDNWDVFKAVNRSI